ncbi:FAD-dependent oxidoreductase [bacterium]|nr:FAD-dependent oxidoreductase [bacterium]
MPEAQTFDLVVIGAGPGGAAAAEAAALLGRKVAVVEATPLVGGAAVNTGTIPSKTLRETALALSGVRSRALHGVDLSLRRGLTVNDLLHHERAVKATEAGQMRSRLDAYGVTVVHGTGSFFDPHTVRVERPTPPGGELYVRGHKILVAIGSAPVRPPLFPFHTSRVHDSDELLFLSALPRSLAVIGAGVIGAEYACMFAAPMPFQWRSIRFWWNEKATRCDTPRVGETALTLTSGTELLVDQVLVCAGRMSRTAELNLAAAGFGVSAKGHIPVDEHFRTAVPHIYAVGDVIGFPALASTSAEQGRVAACHMFGSNAKEAVAKFLPAGIYTIPEVSSAGLTEPEALAKGRSIVVGRADYAQNPRGKIIGDRAGFLKLVFDAADMTLLGVHVIGEQASELVHIGLLALMSGSGAKLFLDTCFNYPTLGDLYKIATHDALIRRASVSGERPGAVVS